MAGVVAMIQTYAPSAEPFDLTRAQCNYELIPDGSKHTGQLYKAVSEGEGRYVVQVGRASFLVPQMVHTQGGQVDLAAWVGMEVEVSRYGERVFARLVPPDKKQMRIWELEELIARHLSSVSWAGCHIPQQEAMEALGLSPDQDFDWQKFCKYSTAKAKREKALAAVVG